MPNPTLQKGKKEEFKQTCVFAEFRRIGEIDCFEMKSGRTVVAKLIDIDTAGYQWTADDTGQRDLTWQVLDELKKHIMEGNKKELPNLESIYIINLICLENK